MKREYRYLNWLYSRTFKTPPNTLEVVATYDPDNGEIREDDPEDRLYGFEIKSGPLKHYTLSVVFRSGPGFPPVLLTKGGAIVPDPIITFNGLTKGKINLLRNCAFFASKDSSRFTISFTLDRWIGDQVDNPFIISNFDFAFKPYWAMPDYKVSGG